ncbi:cytochrome b/b6 domain-containing protein [Xanthobacter sp. DSM 24535]|uniref:cytochrome b/b6 domain-containing protein n=1 Tax=Roseixanthobacter psychrophilus TaxID=3119917 RepID=UPI00372808A9
MSARSPEGRTNRTDMAPLRKVVVWDFPTRLFHWSLVGLIAGAYATANLGKIDLHFLCGYAIIALLLFRLAWGLIGSDTARFATFVRSPLAAWQHLAHFTRPEPDTEVGHNAAGGLMVLVMLTLIGVQVATGLFSNDGLFSEGPLAKYVSPAVSDRLSSLHEFNFNLILATIVLHVVAILAYALVKRHDLVRPMVLGWKRLPATIPAPRIASLMLAACLFILAAGAAWALATFS